MSDEHPEPSAGFLSLARLLREQGRLAELALKLSQPPAENPEDDPENLPDMREDDSLQDNPSPDKLPGLKLQPGDEPPPTEGLLPDADEQ